MDSEIIINTFKDIFGSKAILKHIEKSPAAKDLPILVARKLEFYNVKLPAFNWDFLIAEFKEMPDVRLVENYYKQILKNINGNFVFVFADINTRQRHSLINRQIQFIIPGKFIFIPNLGVAAGAKTHLHIGDKLWGMGELSSVAENIVVKRLLDEKFEGRRGKDFAEALQTQGIIISKALFELEERKIITTKKAGKEKFIFFGSKEELWGKVKKILTNPVVGKFYIPKVEMDLPLAGENALAKNSSLEAPQAKTFALYKRDLKDIKKTAREASDEIQIEVWKRNPKLLANQGVVDGISLYLSLREHADERVQIALKELLKNLGLSDERGAWS